MDKLYSYLAVAVCLLLPFAALAQGERTATHTGFGGGQRQVQFEGKPTVFGFSTGQVAQSPMMPYGSGAEAPEAMIGFPPGVVYFPQVFSQRVFVSKGYFANYVQLHWNIQSGADRIRRFRVFRKELGSKADSVLVRTLPADEYSFQDANVALGKIYEYTVFAEGLLDGVKVPFVNTVQGIGFALPTGTAAGRITYEGGTAVPGVTVLAETKGELGGYALQFDGAHSAVVIPHENDNLELRNGFTFQAWAQYEGTQKGVIFSKSGNYVLSYEPGQLAFTVGDATLTMPFQHPVDSFFHVTASYHPNGKLRLVVQSVDSKDARIDSASVDAGAQPNENTASILLGRTDAGDFWAGSLDEVRLWNIELSEEARRRDFGRFIAGTENGLAAYWRFNEGSGQGTYDFARNGDLFYENHGRLLGAQWTKAVPLSTQLSFKGVTDEEGVYTIVGFPYETVGSLYNFIPMLGVHKFEPNQQTRFVGPSENIFNQVDFTDVSSFRVTGTVVYRNSYFPVEGVVVLVDGKPISDRSGQTIKTDEMGRFAVDVPIGPHWIEMQFQGHTFAEGGRFPKSTATDAEPLFDFQAPISGLEFVDNTLVKLVGRVVGGPVQAAKPIGFGASKNNIGNATVVIRAEKPYDLTRKDSTVSYSEDHFSATARFNIRSVTVNADPVSGEFVAYLPPERYNIQSITAGTGPNRYIFGNSFLTSFSLQHAFIEQESVRADTVLLQVGEEVLINNPGIDITQYDDLIERTSRDTLLQVAVDTFRFDHRLDLTYRALPTIEVTNPNRANGLFGEAVTTYKSKTGTTEEVPLIEGDDYTFGFPIFRQRKKYLMQIEVFEEYLNSHTGETDRVPASDGIIDIVNDLAVNPEKETFELNHLGRVNYLFTAGLPIMAKDPVNPEFDYTSVLNITAFTGNNGAIRTVWREGDPFRGIVFGGYPVGNNFVTKGPEQVMTILRDPPGTASTASFTTGTSTSSSSSFGVTQEFSQEFGIDVTVGSRTQSIIGGLVAGVINETENTTDFSTGFSLNQSFASTNTTTYSTTFEKTFSTSDAPEFVGRDGDVFIGFSTNIVYGESRNLEVVKEDQCSECSENGFNGFKIGQTAGFRLDPEFATGFVYTQKFIEGTLIPNLEKLRNRLITYDPNPNSVVATEKPVYVSLVPTDDPRFGTSNQDPIWGPLQAKPSQTGIGPSYIIKVPSSMIVKERVPVKFSGANPIEFKEVDKVANFTDSVVFYNNEIKEWKFWLAENEKQKLEATPDRNYSFDGGVTIEESVETSKEVAAAREWSVAAGTSFGFETENEFSIFGVNVGLTITSETALTAGVNGATEDIEASTTSYAFTLSDGDDGDYYSVDVKKPKDGFGPVFTVRGGATSCPYQDEERTKYYRPGTVLTPPTVARERPYIKVENPVVANVPDNRAAEFFIVMENNSDTNEEQWYTLTVDESTNPFGAVLEIDGLPIGNGRSFLVQPNTALLKTLKLYTGASGILEYEDITLEISSQCDENMTSSASLSAYFLPGCSDIAISEPANNWVVNTNTEPQEVLNVLINDYDVNYDNFSRILFQYKPAGSATWTTNMVFYQHEEDFAAAQEPKMMIEGAEINYAWDMSALPDREYDIRAVAICDAGPGLIYETPTDILRGIKDVKRPRLFGSPQPADGILSAGDEIMIQFDETIEAGLLTPFNFSVRGVLNNYQVSHQASVTFDGENDYVKIEDGLLLGGSFTASFWLKRDETGKPMTVFSKGFAVADQLEIGFNAADQLTVTIAGQIFTSSAAYTDAQWHHYALAFDKPNNRFNVYRDDVTILERQQVANSYAGTGPITLGRSGLTNDRWFNGNLHELRVWSRAQTLGQVYSQMNRGLSGGEIGLLGYWPMDEAYGNRAFDKARARHAILFAGWEVLPKGQAYSFSGTDEYLTLNTGSTVTISPEMDFTVEMWFNAAAGQTNTVMFSNGKADGTDVFIPSELSFALGFDENGKLYAASNGQRLTAEADYRNNDWHHVAFVLGRSSNATLYVDGQQVVSRSSQGFGGLAGSNMWVGARGFKPDALQTTVDQHFIGSLDEVRVWQLARRQAQIELDRLAKLQGDEVGLVAYYPFDRYVTETGIRLLRPTLADQWSNPFGNNGGNAVSATSEQFDADAPNVKDARPVSKVDFDWVVNNDKILITTAPGMAPLIEKSILEITVQNVEDLRENRMASPATWSAFIDRNQLKWSNDGLAVEKKLYDPYQFTVEAVNMGGTEQRFSVQNIPPWLTVSPSSGVIAPKSKAVLRFTVNPGLNTGYYSEDLYLSGELGFNEKFKLDLRVFAEEPAWAVNPAQFQYSMNVIAQLKINGLISRDHYDKLGAFVNGECRGVAYLKYIEQFDQYQAYLDIYSNQPQGETIELRVWDASEGTEFRGATPNYSFVSNDLKGTPNAPEMVEVGQTFVQNIALQSGWNWVSFFVNSPDMAQTAQVMQDIAAQTGDQVKAQGFVDLYAPSTGWTGTLTNNGGLRNGQMYMIRSANGGNIEVEGPLADPNQSISIRTGWNWIGVIPRFNLSVNEALANFPSRTGDVLKGKTSFATYVEGLGWIGSLRNLVPGEGYMFKASQNGTLVYPKTSSLQGGREAALPQQPPVASWQPNLGRYPLNMTVQAQIEGLASDSIVVGVFAGEECRGFAYPVRIAGTDQVRYFLTVQGELPAERLTFKGFQLAGQKTLVFAQEAGFEANANKGTWENPFVLTLSHDNSGEQPAAISQAQAYPNPFAKEVTLSLPIVEQDPHVVRVLDVTGRELAKWQPTPDVQAIVWDGKDQDGNVMPTGIYLFQVTTGTKVQVLKVVKK